MDSSRAPASTWPSHRRFASFASLHGVFVRDPPRDPLGSVAGLPAQQSRPQTLTLVSALPVHPVLINLLYPGSPINQSWPTTIHSFIQGCHCPSQNTNGKVTAVLVSPGYYPLLSPVSNLTGLWASRHEPQFCSAYKVFHLSASLAATVILARR
jgi:hypothetical protein